MDQRTSAQVAHQARSQALLQVWLSPAFPAGGFAYSHGLEAAVDRGWVADRTSLEPWLTDIVSAGSLRNDLILLAAAWRATMSSDHAQLLEIADLGVALQPSAERFLEATQQGRSFLQQIEAAWPIPDSDGLMAQLDCEHVTHSVAVGIAASLHDIPLADTLRAYAIAFAGNLLSAAIRLSIIGPTESQQIVAALLPLLLAQAAETAALDDLGSATMFSDLASILHETQNTRLFRS